MSKKKDNVTLKDILERLTPDNINKCGDKWPEEEEEEGAVSGWRYGLVYTETDKGCELGLHEVFYSSKGGEIRMEKLGWTEKPIDFIGGSRESIIKQLENALKDAKEHKIIHSNEVTGVITLVDSIEERDSDD